MIHLRMRTLPPQTLTINPDHPIHLAPLVSLHTLLTNSLDLLAFTLSYCYPASHPPTNRAPSSPPTSLAQFLTAQLHVLSQSLFEASSLLKGPPLTTADPSWTTRSVAFSHFLPPHPHAASAHQQQQTGVPPLSFHLAIQDSCLVLWLRSLEPADAPMNFGTKLALAIGTTRRLEHDEAERMFGFCCAEDEDELPVGDGAHPRAHSHSHGAPQTGLSGGVGRHGSFPVGGAAPGTASGLGRGRKEVEVFVREKVRVETADPSLLSLSSKLTALGLTLGVARRNLAAAIGEEPED